MSNLFIFMSMRTCRQKSKKMVAVEEILWNIFTFYALNSNPRDPSRMHNTALVKLAKDILVFDPTMTESPLTLADLQLIYTSSTNSPEKTARFVSNDKSAKMDFEAFVSCLVKIAQRAYPSGKTKEGCMQQLMMDNILPLASRRKPVSIALLLKQPNIEALFKYYEDALSELYKFYTSSADIDRRNKNMVRSMSHLAETFDDQKEVFQQARSRSAKDPANAPNRMGYADFIRFANDFGLLTGLGITTLDLGDIFLTITYLSNFTPQLRRMEFKEFWEAIVRCALVAFQDKKSLSSETKIKGLFLSIWRHIQSSVQDHMNGYGTLSGGGFNTYKGALLRGTQILNDRFVAAWTKDEYRDYLAPLVAPSPTGKEAKEKQQSAVGSSPSSSVISKVLQSSSTSSSVLPPPAPSSTPRTRSSSQSLRSPRPPPPVTPARDSSIDALTEDKLLQIGHKKIADSDNFLVQLPEGGLVRVKIANDADLSDRRISARDLRKLLHDKPAIAGVLYEAMIELGIAQPDTTEQEEEQQEDLRSRSESLDIKDLITNNKPMFGGEHEDYDNLFDDELRGLSISKDDLT